MATKIALSFVVPQHLYSNKSAVFYEPFLHLPYLGCQSRWGCQSPIYKSLYQSVYTTADCSTDYFAHEEKSNELAMKRHHFDPDAWDKKAKRLDKGLIIDDVRVRTTRRGSPDVDPLPGLVANIRKSIILGPRLARCREIATQEFCSRQGARCLSRAGFCSCARALRIGGGFRARPPGSSSGGGGFGTTTQASPGTRHTVVFHIARHTLVLRRLAPCPRPPPANPRPLRGSGLRDAALL